MTSRRQAIQLLGLSPNATPAEVRAAFRRKVIEHHPDTALDGADDSAVRGLIDAYHLLTDATPPTSSHARETGVGASGSGVGRSHEKHSRTGMGQRPTSGQPWCHECLATGRRPRVVLCPACRGGCLVTTLDIDEVRVSRCTRCRGRGRIESLEQCRACDGTGVTRS